MSILSARKMVCNKLSDEFNTLIQPLEDAKGSIKSQISSMKSKLSLMSFSPESEISSAISNLESDVKAVIPEATTPDLTEITNFISSCDFLKNAPTFKNPIALLKGGVNSAINQASGFVDDLTDLLPEFDVGNIIGNIFDKFSGIDLGLPDALGITGIVQSLDGIINCIAGRCGGDYSARIIAMTDSLDDIYNDLNIVSDPTSVDWGKFNVDKIYDDVALSASERLQMTNVVSSIQDSKTAITDGFNNTVGAAKSAARVVEGAF